MFRNLVTPSSPTQFSLLHTLTKQTHYPITVVIYYMSERQYIPEKQDYSRFNELCTVVYQDQTYELCTVVYQDQTLTEISRFDIPFTHISILGFCNGMFFFHKYRTQILYLWNPSIRKYKMLPPHFIGHIVVSLMDLRIILKTMTTKF